MNRNTLKVMKVTETYDFDIDGVRLQGFKKETTWESFIKFSDEAGRIIIAFKSRSPLEDIFQVIFQDESSGSNDLRLISASSDLLKHLKYLGDSRKEDK